MWVGKNNLCAGGMLTATIEYNGWEIVNLAGLVAVNFQFDSMN
jgi:hypothetical protein